MVLDMGINTESRETNGATERYDPDKTISRVAQFIEQLQGNKSSPSEKELITSRLLSITKARKEARNLIGSHGQAIPLFINILRNGTPMAKVNVASTLCVLCKDHDLRLKVLLGGCVPPLLTLLKSQSIEAKKVSSEAIYAVSSAGLSDDHVGMKIFITENVVQTLWSELNNNKKKDKVVEGYVIGALRNLCNDKNEYWRATLEANGVDIIVNLLSSENVSAQSNAASLLARLMLAFSDSIPKIVASGAVKTLLGLLDQKKNITVRASSAEALEALSLKSIEAKKAIVDAQGVTVLIGAIVAPSKESMREKGGLLLQKHSTQALANICGDMSALLLYLGELSQSPRLSAPVADIIGALAYTLMVFDQSEQIKQSEESSEPFDSVKIERILVVLLKPRDNKLVQERVLEAMASLYGNIYLKKMINESEAKKVLVGLITLSSGDSQEYLIKCLIRLCCNDISVWEAIGEREGVQLVISFMSLSSELHQEYSVELLAILANQVKECKWAITAAGGIPQLVQLLESGSHKAREDAAEMLWDLCGQGKDICEVIESAGAIPSFLWLLKNGGSKGQEASSKALKMLIESSDSSIMNQLLALLLGDTPVSKGYIINVLGHLLIKSSPSELVNKGTPANQGLRTLIQILNSSNEKTQEEAASVLADLFNTSQEIRDTLATDEVINSCIKLLTSNTQDLQTQSARALTALSRVTKTKSKSKKSYIAEGDVKPLIKLAKTSSIEAAETAISALANVLLDRNVASEALSEDVVSALIRVLGEGSLEGKINASRAIYQLLKHFPIQEVLHGSAQCRFIVLSVIESLKEMEIDTNDVSDALDLIVHLAKTKQGLNFTYPTLSALAEVPSSLEPLARCLSEGPTLIQDKAIEILSRLCAEQPVILGDFLISKVSSISSLANRIMNSGSLEVRVGGTALLSCALKEHKQEAMDALNSSGYLKLLIFSLVDMMMQNSRCSDLEIEVSTPRGIIVEKSPFFEGINEFNIPDPAIVLGSTAALWLLAIISSFQVKTKLTVFEAGGLEALSERLSRYAYDPEAKEYEDAEGIWISALLVAILFQDPMIVSSPTAMKFIPSLTLLLNSDEMIDKFFAAQAMASLVCNRNKGISLAIANSGAVSGLLSLIGHIESDMPNLIALSEEFYLVRNPDQVVIEELFEIEDIRVGLIARKTIPLLVDLLKPMADKPGAPPFSVRILTKIALENDEFKLLIAESGGLEALSKYLSLSPQDLTEETVSELLRIMFTNPEIRRFEGTINCMSQLIAVLQMGTRDARVSSAKALNELFNSADIRNSEAASQAVKPLTEMLDSQIESEQHASLIALVKLTSGNNSKAVLMADPEANTIKNVYKILSSGTSSLELKTEAAELCFVLFGNPIVRESSVSSDCIEFLILLIHSGWDKAVECGVCALERLLDDEKRVDLAVNFDIVNHLVKLISGSNHRLIETSICALIKLGKDRTPRKVDMVNYGIIDNCLELLPNAPNSLCSTIAELFRILTNSSAISKSPSAVKIVDPLFTVLLRPEFSLWGQHSALQALVNVLEKPQSLETLKLTSSQVIEPLISFLESPSQAIQQLGMELLSHLLAQEHFQQDITTKNAIMPLVQLASIGILNLQQTSIKALESISMNWPEEVAEAGGIFELSKVIIQDDPEPPLMVWESAALVLCNVLKSNTEHYYKVPLVVLVRMLNSSTMKTISIALNGLIMHEQINSSNAVLIAEAGAIDSLLDLLRSHQCEEAAGKLLEALFNNIKVREMKVSKYALAPLAHYLMDTQTKSQAGKLLAALSLGDLSQHEGLARASDSVYACRALINLLEDQPTEEMIMVAICALQSFVVRSRTNRRAVAESGGILVIQELLLSNNLDIAGQAALLIRFLFSNHTLLEYVSNELIRSLTGALEKEFLSTETINDEVLMTIHIILTNFPKLHVSEAATLCIPHLITALKSGSEAAQDTVLNTLCLLKQSWPNMPIDVSKNQAMVASEAIPIMQMLIKTCPPSFHERLDTLMQCLPGCLTVTVKRANNLKQVMGGTNAFCRLTIGNAPARQTKVVSHCTSPEWNEGFTWAFDVPPKGQKLQISCKGKTAFGKASLGRVTIQIDKVVSEGMYSGLISLSRESSKDGSSRSLEIEITWSNRT